MKSYLVIGLGRFGCSLAEMLCSLGNEVMAIDPNQEAVQRISHAVTTAVTADARDLEVLRSLGAQDFDCGIVAIGSDLATNVLVTLNLKELGVKTVICKAHDELQKRALLKIGADQVVVPEREIGIKLAQKLASSSILDFIELSNTCGIAEVNVREDWIGKTLIDLGVRSRYGLNVIAVRRGKDVIVSPQGNFSFQTGDIAVLLGDNTDLARVSEG